MATDERLQQLEAKYEGYKVVDNNGSSIGKVDDLFVDEDDREEYVGVKMGLFGLSGTVLIPMEVTRTDERDRTITVQESKERVKDAPSYTDQRDMTPEYESEIRRHFGLESSGSERGSYDQYSDTGTDQGDREDRGVRGEHAESSGVPAGGARGGDDRRDDRDRRSSGEESGDYREGSGVPAETGGSGDSSDSSSESRESSGESDVTTGGRPGEESGASEEGERTRIRRRSRRREESSFSEEEEETERI